MAIYRNFKQNGSFAEHFLGIYRIAKVMEHSLLNYSSILKSKIPRMNINNVHSKERDGLNQHFGNDLRVPLLV